ncbi:TPA: glycerophosphodiester phosphodiesterase [Streptococcus suis]|nr:glycerophosphodiester phosphodiesterase [Streptococcus suis]
MKRIRREFQKIYYNLDKILLLFASSFAFMEFIWIPLNSWLAEALLSLTGHAYLSPTNALAVFSENGFVTLLFLLLFVANIFVAYLELALLFTGVWQLLDQNVKHLPDYLRDVSRSMLAILRHISLPKLIFLLFYAVILLPFLRRLLNIYYFNKLVIPEFVVDYLTNILLVGLLFLIALLVFFWLASRLMYAIPKVYFEHRSVKESIRYSWDKTSGRNQVGHFFSLIGIILQSTLLFFLSGLCFYTVQVLVERFVPGLAYPMVIVHYVLLRLAFYSAIALFMTKFVTLVTGKHLPSYRRKRLRHRLRLAIVATASLYYGIQGAVTFYYPLETLPITISHRGVDNANGVQNTLDSLEKTAQLSPDFVEMDIQETKDLEFVVMHDTDLQALTGNPGGTHDYTLAELTKMTASENGMSSPVPSFDAYLDKADQLGQKLLVEIKVTDQDSPDLTKTFLEKYGQRLLDKGHQIQSLDYQTIIEVKEYDEALVSFFILPFNSIYPQTLADGYTMEYSSLDQNFMVKSWLHGKSVYAWTPNDEETMTQMILLQVDGIITDQLAVMQDLMKNFQENTSYSDLFLIQFQKLLYQFEG